MYFVTLSLVSHDGSTIWFQKHCSRLSAIAGKMLTSHILSKYDDWTHFILMNFSKLHRDLLNDEIFCLLRTYRHFHFISLSFFSIVSLPAGLGSSSDLIIIYYYHYMLSCSTNSRSLCNHTESYWSRPERAQRLTAKALFDDFEHIAFFAVCISFLTALRAETHYLFISLLFSLFFFSQGEG